MSIAYNTVTFIKMKEVNCASGVIEHIWGQRRDNLPGDCRSVISPQCLKAQDEWQMYFCNGIFIVLVSVFYLEDPGNLNQWLKFNIWQTDIHNRIYNGFKGMLCVNVQFDNWRIEKRVIIMSFSISTKAKATHRFSHQGQICPMWWHHTFQTGLIMKRQLALPTCINKTKWHKRCRYTHKIRIHTRAGSHLERDMEWLPKLNGRKAKEGMTKIKPEPKEKMTII